MKKLTAIALCLCMLLSATLAQAQALYVPGQRTRQLIAGALDAGYVVAADMNLRLDANPEIAFGTRDDEAASAVRSLLEAIGRAHVRAGLGHIDGGLRMTLGGELFAQDGMSSVSADFAANVTREGLSVESDLIPGRRVTATWRTLLHSAGLPESVIDTLLSARELDVGAEAMLQALIVKLGDELSKAARALAPYAAVAMRQIASLPMKVEKNAPEADGYPAAAVRVSAAVTAQDIAAVLRALTDKLETDKAAIEFFSFGSAEEKDAFFASLRERIDGIDRSQIAFDVTVGLSESNLPLYFIMTGLNEGRERFGLSVIATAGVMPDDSDALDGSYEFTVDLYTLDEQGAIGESFSFTMTVITQDDPVLGTATDLSILISGVEGGDTVYDRDYTLAISGALSHEENLPVTTTDLYDDVTMTVDGDPVRTVSSATCEQRLTSDDGEAMTGSCVMDFYLRDEFVASMGMDFESLVLPMGDAMQGNAAFNMTMPALGIDELVYTLVYACEPYDIADTHALAELKLEDVSAQDLQNLAVLFYSTSREKASALLSVLPPELIALLAGQADVQPAAEDDGAQADAAGQDEAQPLAEADVTPETAAAGAPEHADASAQTSDGAWGYQITVRGKPYGDPVTGFSSRQDARKAAIKAIKSVPGGRYTTGPYPAD